MAFLPAVRAALRSSFVLQRRQESIVLVFPLEYDSLFKIIIRALFRFFFIFSSLTVQ